MESLQALRAKQEQLNVEAKDHSDKLKQMKEDRASGEEMVRNIHREIGAQTSRYEQTLDASNKVQAEIAKLEGDLESIGE